MAKEEDINKFLEKVDKVTKEKKLDLSSDEDLSIAIMNLIGIEEHLFFTAEKTGKKAYYEVLNQVRELRKELLKKIVKDYEGEIWCISKHLLSSSMRLIEVGTKHLTKGDKKEAYDFFEKAYNMYSLFWALNLKMIDTKTIKDNNLIDVEQLKREYGYLKSEKYTEKENTESNKESLSASDQKSFFSKLGTLVKKAIDCCKE